MHAGCVPFQFVLSIGPGFVQEGAMHKLGKGSAKIQSLVTQLSEAILEEEGDALLEDPSGLDLRILELLREVGSGTTMEVLNRLSGRLVEREKKDRG